MAREMAGNVAAWWDKQAGVFQSFTGLVCPWPLILVMCCTYCGVWQEHWALCSKVQNLHSLTPGLSHLYAR